MSVRSAQPGESIKPRVFKDRWPKAIWPWIVDVPYIPSGGDHVLIWREIVHTWEEAIYLALTKFSDHRVRA